MSAFLRLAALAFVPFIMAAPPATDCTGTISSLDDVDNVVKCMTVNVNSFTVPAGKTFDLDLASGTTVNLRTWATFAVKNWAVPLFQISGKSITFNGNGHTVDGNGPSYWDGEGTNGGVTKPHPMMKCVGSRSVLALLLPAYDNFRIKMSAPTLSAGDAANSKSDGDPAGHNTDGFDCSMTDLTIEEDSTIHNQDDCIAINSGSNIVFQRKAALGSVSSDVTVSGITITDNTITNKYALRIKTKASATGSTVSDITYSGNTGTGLRKFGVLIDQVCSYPSTLGTPGTGVKLSGVNFVGSTNSITVASGAKRVAVNCGDCSGTWDWSALKVSGGSAGTINYSSIENFSQ
ncbi:endo-polygalacturonase PG1 [Ganoderma leucocontextum]|nr:endo-polygalacturonase PG1 [Ganoderma leucocontextum]